MTRRTDEWFLDRVARTSFLKDKTKKIYLARIERMQRDVFGGKPLARLVAEPEETVARLRDHARKAGLGDHALDGYVAAFVSLWLYNETLREDMPDVFLRWKAAHADVREPIEAKYRSNRPTERQASAYVPFEELCKIRDGLGKGTPERLLLACYTMIPPLRASDFHCVPVLASDPPDRSQGNFLVLSAKPPRATLTLNEYKTKSKYGQQEIRFPPELVREVLDSLRETPRRHLFEGRGSRCHTPNSFTIWGNGVLKRVTGKDSFSFSTLRHIYITRKDLALERATGEEQELVARQMLHSSTQQRRYNWFAGVDA